MDLLDCPCCSKRFVVRDAGEGSGWICRGCQTELRLLARSLPGDLRRLSEMLHADHLEPIGDPAVGQLIEAAQTAGGEDATIPG